MDKAWIFKEYLRYAASINVNDRTTDHLEYSLKKFRLASVLPALCSLSLALGVTGFSSFASAQEFPKGQTITIVVGFVPGADVRLPSAKGLALAFVAGAGIGTILIVLKFSPSNSGLASVLVMRLVSAGLLNLLLLATWLRSRKSNGSTPKSIIAGKFWWAVIAAGIFDSSANIFFTLALRSGSISVVSVLTALYPLGTIILARLILKERIARIQMFGVLLALSGSAILAVA